jgi:Zn-dependent M28 family amino/carboxypeptidase
VTRPHAPSRRLFAFASAPLARALAHTVLTLATLGAVPVRGATAAREAAATGVPRFSPAQLAEARAVRDRALTDDTAYELIRSLTSRVGPRLAGSPGDSAAVTWALDQLRSLGFQNVRAERVKVPVWRRGDCRVELVSPWPQSCVAAALGGSEATPPGGIEAEVLPVTNLDELARIDSTRVAGRIVFFSGRMTRASDGSGYSRAVAVRGRGAIDAARRGAVAVVIRSVGTSRNRVAHTGGMRYEAGVPRIPALALSNPDADLLEDQLASGRPVRMRITNTSSTADSTWSANVVGEIVGRERPRELVVLGAHLDSWDLGTGAHDDAAGVAIVTAAARLIGDAKQRPRRTIRVVLFANEEFGLSGARAYARDHAGEVAQHVLGMESDLGAYQPLGLRSRVPADRLPAIRQMHSVLAPLGVEYRGNDASGSADVGQLVALGVPACDLDTNASEYFDLHHTANDTFDKVDPLLVRQNVACYAALAWLAADLAEGFGRAPAAPAAPAGSAPGGPARR